MIVTDQEYPVRVAFSLLNKILEEFTTKFSKDVWEAKAREGRQNGKMSTVDWKELSDYVVRYQDPKQADTIMKVQQELDETKIILVRPPISLPFLIFNLKRGGADIFLRSRTRSTRRSNLSLSEERSSTV